MNTIGISLTWCALQVTLISAITGVLYLLVRRRWSAAASSLVFTGLLMVIVLSLLAGSPWPRWASLEQSAQSQKAVQTPSVEAPLAGSGVEPEEQRPVPSAEALPVNAQSTGELFWLAIAAEFSQPRDEEAANAWRWPAVVAVVLMAAMGFGLLRLVLGMLAVRRQRLRSRRVSDSDCLELVDVLRAELSCRKSIELRQSDDLVTAATIGWRRPVVLLPPDWRSWTPKERRAILAHEIAHVRGRDFLTTLLGQLGLVLHFYNPLVHWLASCLHLEQELAADAAAASISGGSRAYLTTIAELALRQQDRPLALHALAFLPTRTTFLRRIAVLRDSKLRFRRISPLARSVAIATVILSGLLAAGLRGPGRQSIALAEDSSPPILPPNVRASLDGNASLFSNVLITGERTRRFLADPETVLRTLKTKETEGDFTQSLRFELRFKGPHYRESIEYLPGRDVYTRDAIYEISYDGTQFILGFKRLKDLTSSSVHIYTPRIAAEWGKLRHTENSLAHMKFWYLRETGFIGPQTIASLGQPVKSFILDAADQGRIVSVSEAPGGNEKILEVVIERPEPWQSLETFDIATHEAFLELKGGTDILQMRMERERRRLAGKHRVIRFWLNRTLGYAVEEKWELRKETGKTMFHTKNSEFIQVAPDGIWMPRRCVVESHAYYTVPLFISPEPLFETVIQVDKCEPGNFDNDAFRIWYEEPGVVVSDWTSPKATLKEAEQYEVPDRPSTDD